MLCSPHERSLLTTVRPHADRLLLGSAAITGILSQSFAVVMHHHASSPAKPALRVLAILILLVNALGALLGGISLMLFPDGSPLRLSTDLLVTSPFTNYFLPGLVLFAANGVGSCMVLYLMLARKRKAGLYLVLQGVLLLGWILIQVLMIPITDILQGIFALMGLTLLLIGDVLAKDAS